MASIPDGQRREMPEGLLELAPRLKSLLMGLNGPRTWRDTLTHGEHGAKAAARDDRRCRSCVRSIEYGGGRGCQSEILMDIGRAAWR